MRAKGRIRPSRPISAIGLIVGAIFIGIGIFVVIPNVGVFGVFWTLFALALTGYHAANLFSERGVAHEVVDFDMSSASQPRGPSSESPEQRLARLDGLKRKGLVTDDEYREQRQRILDDI